jgi:SAM-dependent methyltransferase
MSFLKDKLRKSPRLYGALQRSYYRVMKAAETRVFGSRLHEWLWRSRFNPSAVRYSDDRDHPHREHLAEEIAKLGPFTSVLEIGCNSGPNLLLLARRFPTSRFTGVDINRRALEAGRERLKKECLANVDLFEAKADDLSRFPDKNFDVTFSDATFLYVGPDKFGAAVLEMTRVTRKALLFNEWNLAGGGKEPASLWYDLHWVHDYATLLARFVPGAKITVAKLPAGLWGPGGWEDYGAMIAVLLPGNGSENRLARERSG